MNQATTILTRTGWQEAMPTTAFSGVLTGLNLTGRNPNAGRGGTIAEWNAADFNIEEIDGVLVVANSGPPSRAVTTQAVLSIETISDLDEALFSEKPRVEQRPIRGTERFAAVDSDMQKFFRSSDVQQAGLLHVPVVGREKVIRISEGDVRLRDFDRIRSRIAGRRQIEIEVDALQGERSRRWHPFMARAKYKLSDAE